MNHARPINPFHRARLHAGLPQPEPVLSNEEAAVTEFFQPATREV